MHHACKNIPVFSPFYCTYNSRARILTRLVHVHFLSVARYHLTSLSSLVTVVPHCGPLMEVFKPNCHKFSPAICHTPPPFSYSPITCPARLKFSCNFVLKYGHLFADIDLWWLIIGKNWRQFYGSGLDIMTCFVPLSLKFLPEFTTSVKSAVLCFSFQSFICVPKALKTE